MKRVYISLSSFLALLMCVAAFISTGAAQTRDKYVISAKAGGINFVTGNVTVDRKGKGVTQSVTEKDNLDSGDVVTTGAGGRVEVLLNPGSYLRVTENSEFVLADASLESLRIKLLKGSAIIEAVGTDDTRLMIEVVTPQTSALIVKRGIYRINVLQGGATEVLVRKGRALIGNEVVKGGKKIVVSGGRMEVAKLNKKELDSLDLWSRERAEYLASVNRRLQQSTLYSTMDIFNADWSASSIFKRHYGVWVYDPSRNCYVFAPFSRGGWSSPYGYNYPSRGSYPSCCNSGNRDNNYNDPRNRPPATTTPSAGETVVGPVNPPSSGEPSGRRPRDRDRTPPADRERPGDGGGREGFTPINRPDPGSRPDSPSRAERPSNSDPSPQRSDPPARSEPPSQPAPSYSPPPAPAYSPPPPSSPPAPVEREMPQGRDRPND